MGAHRQAGNTGKCPVPGYESETVTLREASEPAIVFPEFERESRLQVSAKGSVLAPQWHREKPLKEPP